MATDGITGFGCTLTGGTTGAIGQVVSLDGPSMEAEAVDISSTGSASNYREFVPGMIDPGEISGTVIFKESEAETLIDNMGLTAETWTLAFSDGSNFACSGFLTGQGTSLSFDGRIEQSFKIKLSGIPSSKWEGS